MIIFEPEVQQAGGTVRVEARVAFSSRPELPEKLSFEFPERHRASLTDRSDGFLTALLLPAMQYRESIEVRGRVSPRLLLGLAEYQRAFHAWFPWRFTPIDVHCEAVAPSGCVDGEGAVATAFSGGVDSFYTLWSHLAERDANPCSAIRNALFVHGFDIPLAKPEAYHTASKAFAPMLAELGVDLVTARTNAANFVPPRNWGVFHGAAIAAVAQLLGGLFGRFYVPASHTYNDLVPWGSDPRVDHLLSTESLQIVHDGASVTRVAKTAAIGTWPPTFGRLRVCWPRNDGRLTNCCSCEKCVRTMVTLDLLGALREHSSFPLPLERRAVRRCSYRVASDFTFPREIIQHAAAVRRWDVVVDLRWAIARSRARILFHRLGRPVKQSVLRAIGRNGDVTPSRGP